MKLGALKLDLPSAINDSTPIYLYTTFFQVGLFILTILLCQISADVFLYEPPCFKGDKTVSIFYISLIPKCKP